MGEHPLQRRRRDLAWWQTQADEVRAHRRQLKLVPLVGLPLAAAVALWHPLAGSAVVATVALVWMMGLYMTRVRDDEFAGHVEEARQDVARLEAERATRDGAGPEGPAPGPP